MSALAAAKAKLYKKNLVNIGAVTTEIMLLICVPLSGYWAKIGPPIFIRRAGIPKCVGRLKYRWAR